MVNFSVCLNRRVFVMYMYVIVIALDTPIFNNKKKTVRIFLISPQQTYVVGTNIYCGYPSEASRKGASDEYPKYVFWWRNKKITHLDNPHILRYVSHGIFTI